MSSSTLAGTPASTPVAPGWRGHGVALLLVLLALLLLYRDTAVAMVGIWYRSDTFAHAFLVPPIALWLIWRQRERLLRLSPRIDPLFALPMLLAGGAWLLGELVAVNALTQLALVTLLVAAVPLLLGRRLAWEMAFPLAFMFFCVPIGEFMMPTLMEATADFTVAALRATGVPVYREGLQFVIPSGNWSVVEACSGLRYLIASAMVGTLFAYLNYNSLRRRLVFIAIAIALPLLANWVRAYLIVMLGHLSGNELATGADHLIYGWVFFGAIMLAMFMLGARWSEPELKPVLPGVAAAGPVATWQALLGLVLGLLVGLLPLAGLGWVGGHDSDKPALLAAPQLAPWERIDGEPLLSPHFEKPSAELAGQYRTSQDAQTVGLHIAYYRAQDYESKLINSQNQIVRSKDPQWHRLASGSATVALQGAPIRLRSVELRAAAGPARQLLAWQFFWVDGQLTASDARAKLLNAWQRIAGRGDDAASIIIYTVKSPDNAAAAQTTLQGFLERNWPAIAAQLQATQAAGR